MARRIYFDSLWKKMVALLGIGSGATLGVFLFTYLALTGAIEVTGYSDDMVCAGTLDNPCYAYINFTVPFNDNNKSDDIFIYPLNHTGLRSENVDVSFDAEVQDWSLQRSWGSGWRTIKLEKPWSTKVKYAVRFKEGSSYQVRLKVLKNSPDDYIKWTFGNLDPAFLSVEKTDIVTDSFVKPEPDGLTFCAYREICNPTDLEYLTELSPVKEDYFAKTDNLGFEVKEKYKKEIITINDNCSTEQVYAVVNKTHPVKTLYNKSVCYPFEEISYSTYFRWVSGIDYGWQSKQCYETRQCIKKQNKLDSISTEVHVPFLGYDLKEYTLITSSGYNQTLNSSLVSSEDAQVYDLLPDTKYGLTTYLVIQSRVDKLYISYMLFDFGGPTTMSYANLTVETVLAVSNLNPNVDMEFYYLDDDYFNETTITWNTKDAQIDNSTATLIHSQAFDTYELGKGYGFNITGVINGDDDGAFIIMMQPNPTRYDSNTRYVIFGSRQDGVAKRPYIGYDRSIFYYNYTSPFNNVTFVSDCSTNDSIKVSRNSVSMNNLTENYYVFPSYDDEFYVNLTNTSDCTWFFLTVGNTTTSTTPTVAAVSPANGTTAPSQSQEFVCNISAPVGVSSMSFFINDTLNQTNTSGANNAEYSFTTYIPIGDSAWLCQGCNNDTTPICVNTTERVVLFEPSLSNNVCNPYAEFDNMSWQINTDDFQWDITTFRFNSSDALPSNISECVFNISHNFDVNKELNITLNQSFTPTYAPGTIWVSCGNSYNLSAGATVYNASWDGTEILLNCSLQYINISFNESDYNFNITWGLT